MKTKLEQRELEVIQKFQQQENSLVHSLGEITVTEILLNDKKEIYKKELIKLQKDQSEFVKILNDKYGDGNINLETGEFESN